MKPRIKVDFVDGWHVARVIHDGGVLKAGRHLTRKAARLVAKHFLETLNGGVVRKNPNAFRSPHPRAQRRPKCE